MRTPAGRAWRCASRCPPPPRPVQRPRSSNGASPWSSNCLAALGLCFQFSVQAHAQCFIGGGGAIPTAGAGNGIWPNAMPSFPLVATLDVTVPPGAMVLNAVKLNVLTHTWAGDLQFVLETPGGAQFNVFHRLGSTNGTAGCDGNLGGDYRILDPTVVFDPCANIPLQAACAPTLAGGDWAQTFGDWPGGAISNTPLEQIPIASGTWTLRIYDWVGGDIGALTSFELCFGSPTLPGGSEWNCVNAGAGGVIPAAGAVEGTWPTVLPTGQLSSTLAVSVPAGATRITGVEMRALNHGWLGDCHIVLTSPAGVNYNIFQQNDGVFAGGCQARFVGDYEFVAASSGGDVCGSPASTFACPAFVLAPGVYRQFFGAWPSGAAGIVNVDLGAIPLASGDWTLSIYDWYVTGDDGALGSRALCFDRASLPVSYCTAGTSTNGCVPVMSATAQPNLANDAGCVLTCANVEGQKLGLVFYGVDNTGFTPNPWGTGTSWLCVKAPTQRTGTSNSGGAFNACDGSLSLDWDAFQIARPNSLGNPFSAGDSIFVQTWYRDPPSAKTTNLSDALELTVQP